MRLQKLTLEYIPCRGWLRSVYPNYDKWIGFIDYRSIGYDYANQLIYKSPICFVI